MSDIDTSTELEQVGITGNGTTDAVEATSAPASDATAAPEAPKPVSLDDALAKAFEKHAPDAVEPRKAVTPTSTTTPAPKPIDPISGRELEPMKAPAGWTPLLREKWGTIDPTVQKFIVDRERDMAQNITRSGEDRKIATDFKTAMSPFEGTFKQFNMPAVAIVKDVMTQWNLMQTGTPQQKAALVHGLITHFRPDPQTLQQLFAGQRPHIPSAPTPQPSVDELVERKLREREEQQTLKTAEQSVGTWTKARNPEFLDDVRPLMIKILDADLVNSASAKDLNEVFDRAYKLACDQHPDVAEILRRRGPAANAPTMQPAQQARPTGSVKPSLGGGQKSKQPAKKMSLDDALNAAFQKHSA